MASTQKIAGAGGTTTSFSNAPQASDDNYNITEAQLESGGGAGFTYNAAAKVVTLDVMSNDLGGNAKSLWSIDDGGATTQDIMNGLMSTDVGKTWETTANGNRIMIVDGKVQFDVSNALAGYGGTLDGLGANETITDSFTYAIKLGNGTLSYATVHFSLTGSNDRPTITAGIAGLDETNSPLHTTGSITVGDADVHDVVTVTVDHVVVGGTGSLPAGLTNADIAGMLHLDSSATVNGKGTVGWDFNSTPQAFDSLAVGETLVLTYTVKATDNSGAANNAGTNTVTITITGTNDVPTAVADNGSMGENETKAFNVIGNDTLDADHTAANTISIGSNAVTVTGPDGVTLGTPAVTVGDDNQIHVDPGTAFDGLALGEHATLTIHYTLTGDAGDVSSADLVIDVVGANDAPVLAAVTSGSVAEIELSSSTTDAGLAGTLSATDVDHGDSKTFGIDGGTDNGNGTVSLVGTYGTLTVDTTTGAYSYAKDGAAIEALAQGDTDHDTFTVTVTDGQGVSDSQTYTVDVTGANDAPAVLAALTASAAEGDASVTRDLLAGASDVDHGETATLSVTDVSYVVDGGGSSPTAPAGVSVDTSNHTVTVDPTNTAFDHLAVGEHETIVVSYNVTDVNGASAPQTETITINGTNDKPTDIALSGNTIAEHATGTVGTLSTTDVDTSDTHTYSILGGTGSGLFTISGDNVVVNTGIDLSPEANKDHTLDIQTNDGHGGLYHEVFTVTVTNDTSDDVVIATLPPTYNGPNSGEGSDPNNFDSSGPVGDQNPNAFNNNSSPIYGGSGNDHINGANTGLETIYGGSGDDQISGNGGNDAIYGGSGNDTIAGGGGDDQIYGGFGADSIIAGNGNDTIHYLSLNDTNDTISSFASGHDKIDLSQIDANSSVAGNQAFAWGGEQSGQSVLANSVTWYHHVVAGTDVVEVLADTDGNVASAEFHITLSGVSTLDQNDFNTL